MFGKSSVAAVAVIMVLLRVGVAAAQTASPVVTVGQPFKVSAEHDGKDTSGYRVKVDGAKVGQDAPLSSLVLNVATLDAPAIAARGAHTVQLCAFNADGEACTAPLAITAVLPTPKPPLNLRVVIVASVAANGDFTFRLQQIEPRDTQ